MFEVVRPHRRRGARRAYRARCQAIRARDSALVGTRLLDLSPRGARIACDEEVAEGDELAVSFRAPWLGPHVVIRGEIRRVIEGWRDGDPGYAAGVRFIDPDVEVRRALAERLRPFPLTPSARPHPADYAETVRRIHAGF